MMVTRSQAAIPSSTVLVADVMLGLKILGYIQLINRLLLLRLEDVNKSVKKVFKFLFRFTIIIFYI